jgi:hypothetical protein
LRITRPSVPAERAPFYQALARFATAANDVPAAHLWERITG